MDLLVVPESMVVPARITERALRLVRFVDEGMSAQLLAHLRSHVPRTVGVVQSEATAVALERAGFEVELFTDVTPSPGGQGGITVSPISDTGPPMEVAESILETVGNTPLVRLARVGRDIPAQVLAKLEHLNPGGSVKDRPALTMIEAAERAGSLRPGGTIVEPTSGNTGVGLAIVAARKRYKCIFVVPDKVSDEKINLLRAYGAEVVVCPTAVPPDDPESYYSVSRRLSEEIPGAFKPDQYSNPANPQAHYETTGPEIWRQTAGRITHFVAGVGTAGTIVGTARYLKEQNPDIEIIGADPEGSVYSGGSGRPYLVEGVGEDFFPGNFDAGVIDRIISVPDRESFRVARRMTSEEGIFVGGSSGLAVAAALRMGDELSRDDVVVVLIPDSGRGYLSKLYNDSWLGDYGFSRSSGPSAREVLAAKGAGVDLPELVHVHPHELVRDVAGIMKEYGVSQVVVVTAEPPIVMGEVVGGAAEDDLLRSVFADPAVLDQPISRHMTAVGPTIGVGEPVELAISRLENSDALLVVDSGSPIGVLTRTDLLDFVASRSRPAG